MSQVTVRSLVYQIDGQSYEGRLAFDVNQQGPRPGLLMAPNWMGVGAGAEDIARSVAANGYVVLIADLYGQTLRVELIDWLRGQKKFAGVDALKAQMRRDLDETRGVEGWFFPVDAYLFGFIDEVRTLEGRGLREGRTASRALGYQQLLAWARGFGPLRRAGVEGTSSYGAALTRHLAVVSSDGSRTVPAPVASVQTLREPGNAHTSPSSASVALTPYLSGGGHGRAVGEPARAVRRPLRRARRALRDHRARVPDPGRQQAPDPHAHDSRASRRDPRPPRRAARAVGAGRDARGAVLVQRGIRRTGRRRTERGARHLHDQPHGDRGEHHGRPDLGRTLAERRSGPRGAAQTHRVPPESGGLKTRSRR